MLYLQKFEFLPHFSWDTVYTEPTYCYSNSMTTTITNSATVQTICDKQQNKRTTLQQSTQWTTVAGLCSQCWCHNSSYAWTDRRTVCKHYTQTHMQIDRIRQSRQREKWRGWPLTKLDTVEFLYHARYKIGHFRDLSCQSLILKKLNPKQQSQTAKKINEISLS